MNSSMISLAYIIVLISACGGGEGTYPEDPHNAPPPPGIERPLTDAGIDSRGYFFIRDSKVEIEFPQTFEGQPLIYTLESCGISSVPDQKKFEPVVEVYCKEGFEFKDSKMSFFPFEQWTENPKLESYIPLMKLTEIGISPALKFLVQTKDEKYFSYVDYIPLIIPTQYKGDLIPKEFTKEELATVDEKFQIPLKLSAFLGEYPRLSGNKGSSSEGGYSTSSFWYMGERGDRHYMSTAEHVTRLARVKGKEVYFPYLDIYAEVNEVVFEDVDHDFAVIEVSFPHDQDISELQDMPMDVNYEAKDGDRFVSIGYSPLFSKTLYPGFRDFDLCKFEASGIQSAKIRQHLHESGPEVKITSTSYIPTYCPTFNGDSGGMMVHYETGKVITNIAIGSHMTQDYSLEAIENFRSTSDAGDGISYLFPLNLVRAKILSDLPHISIDHRENIRSFFNPGAKP